MKKIIKLIISICIITLIMPITVYAENNTYVIFDENKCAVVFKDPYGTYSEYYNFTSTNSVRVVMLHYGNNASFFAASEEPFKAMLTARNVIAPSCPVPTQSATSTVVDGKTYYYYQSQRQNFVINKNNGNAVIYEDIPYIESNNLSISQGIYYTFGDGAIDPVEPSIYGTLKNLTYSTSIVGSGNGTGSSNIDTISWYPFSDSNNKMFGTDGKVELRVVPGDYISGTQEGLLTQTYSDFVLDYANAGHLATVNAYQGSYKVSWGVVMNKLSMTWPALQLIWDGDYWKKIGWVYQARYHFEDDEDEDSWSEWQTVYTITSSTPTGTNGLDPSDGTAMPGFYQDVQDSYNTTSIVNNNTNVTYYINNVPTTINVTPENENPSSGDSFWDWIGSLINALLDLVGTVGGWIKDLITAVIGLAGDIINGILGLFQLPDFTINNYNTEVQTIKQNSGIFGQAVDFTSDVKTQLDLISTTPQDLSFTFPGISLMNVQVIPEVNASYTQIVSDLGLTDFHNMVYMFTDGFVIISLIVLVYRKLMGVLRK